MGNHVILCQDLARRQDWVECRINPFPWEY